MIRTLRSTYAATASSVVAAFAFAVAGAACSGASATISDPGSADAAAGGSDSDAATDVPSPDGGTRPPGRDGGGGSPDAADPTPFVTEKPAPECHDLEQKGERILAVGKVGAPPAQTMPLTALPTGLYVATSMTEYGTAVAAPLAEAVTVYVTPTRYYYRTDTATETESLTTDWSVTAGKLRRTVLCRVGGVGQVVEHRVDRTDDGFVVYGVSAENRPLAVRYVRRP